MQIVVRQISGLGNQIFQYAAGKYYARRYNATMRLGIDRPKAAVSHGYARPFLLPHFSITTGFTELSTWDKLLLLTENRRLQSWTGIPKMLMMHALKVQVVAESFAQRYHFQADLPIDKTMDEVYLVGYWQVHQIADAISTELRAELSFLEAPTGRNAELLRMIYSCKSPVSLHMRRGDYTLAIEGNVALPMDYYGCAIRTIRDLVPAPTFFVFSDDIKFARNSLGQDIDVVFVDHNDAATAHEDLRLMSACSHHIIANSSFSWWGAWLNPHDNKIVIAPKNWMVGQCASYRDLFPQNWLLI